MKFNIFPDWINTELSTVTVLVPEFILVTFVGVVIPSPVTIIVATIPVTLSKTKVVDETVDVFVFVASTTTWSLLAEYSLMLFSSSSNTFKERSEGNANPSFAVKVLDIISLPNFNNVSSGIVATFDNVKVVPLIDDTVVLIGIPDPTTVIPEDIKLFADARVTKVLPLTSPLTVALTK